MASASTLRQEAVPPQAFDQVARVELPADL
jgi:hypothetical protein